MTTAVWWIRRDLRLADNPALTAAVESAEEVLPVFVLDPALLESRWSGEKRVAFLLEGLRALDSDLRRRGSRLIVRRGRSEPTLRQVLEDSGADKIFAHEDYSAFSRRRDAGVAGSLPVEWVGSPAIRRPGSVLKKNGEPYTVFTPFMRTWKDGRPPLEASLPPAPEHIQTPSNVEGHTLPVSPRWVDGLLFEPGEAAASRRLEAFADGPNAPVRTYGEMRDRVDLKGTSGLSPHLRFGMLSAARAAHTAYSVIDAASSEEAKKSAETWLNELIWRDFFLHILDHFPHVQQDSFREAYRGLAWREAEDDFRAWSSGQTGYPLVDAAMRQLDSWGWMHNRARMVVASFLVKDLLIDWRRGELFFMQSLIDGDPASNNGGWQWSAGTGTDAAPYFRIFNPVSQSQKHDPHGSYIRQWVPELRPVPDEFIHEPWRMDVATQKQYGCVLGVDYPARIVRHAHARERALEAFARARHAAENEGREREQSG